MDEVIKNLKDAEKLLTHMLKENSNLQIEKTLAKIRETIKTLEMKSKAHA